MADATPTPQSPIAPSRRTWTLPSIRELPKLTDLTLASAIGGGGGTGGSGSTVFGLLTSLSLGASLAVGLLAGCSSPDQMAPSDGGKPNLVASIPCVANVEKMAVLCGGPLAAPGQELLGGQGYHVVLRSANVAYIGTDFTFDVSVQNLSTQTIGTDGSVQTGLSVFFVQEPVATSGTGTITIQNANTGTFTAANQTYYAYADSLPYLAMTGSETWTFAMPVTVTTFAFTVMVAADVGDVGGVLRWETVPGLGQDFFYDIATSGPNDAVAVGFDGIGLKWDGSSWTALPAVTADELVRVAALAPGEYVASGDSGRLYRLKGKIWTLVHTRADSKILYDIWVRNSSEFFAIGQDGAVTRWSGGVFTDSDIDPTELPAIITGTSDGSKVTVTTQGGLSWTSTDGGNSWGTGDSLLAVDNTVTDIAYDADNKLLVGSVDLASFTGMITQAGSDTIFLAVAEIPMELLPFDRDSLTTRVLDVIIFSGNGGSYYDKVRYGASPVHDRATVSDSLDSAAFNARTVSRDAAMTQLLLVDDFGAVLAGSGGSFAPVQTFASCGCFSGMWGVEDTVFVVDGSTTLWKVVDGVRTALTAPLGADQLWGLGSTELYVIADSTVWKGDGVGAWTSEYVMTGNGDLFTDIWGDAASGNLIALGDGGRWRTRVGGIWGEGASLGVNVTGVWGCSGSQAWIVSQDGKIFNWDGGTGATEDLTYSSNYAAWFHRNVTGSGCSDVWVSGPSNELFHWNGAAWDSLFAPGPLFHINASASKGPNEVYIGGDEGIAAIATAGGGFTRIPVPNQGRQLVALWPLLNGELIALADLHVMRGVR